MKNLKSQLVKNWKTTLGGVCLMGCTVMMFLGKMDAKDFSVATGAIVSMIAFLSKDGNHEED